MFWFFSCEACGILVPQPGSNSPQPPALEGVILTTWPPGKSSLPAFFLKLQPYFWLKEKKKKTLFFSRKKTRFKRLIYKKLETIKFQLP